jgi:hypothetical protein
MVIPLAIAPRVVTAELRTNGGPRSSLRGAKLAPAVSEPCTSGPDFIAVELDGVEQSEGPVDLQGPHDLALTFVDDSTQVLRHPVAIDLDLGDARTSRCARVPLIVGRDAPDWKLMESSAGFLFNVVGRAYPFSTTSSVGVQPVGSFGMRLGVGFGDYRVWSELLGAGTRTFGYADLVLAVGADRTVWEQGRLAFLFGAAYDFVFNLYRAPGAERADSRYFLHGPRLTPSLSYTFLRTGTIPSLPVGRRTLYAEIETPVSLWFGTNDAPRTVLVPGVGLSLSWVF